VRPPGVEGDLYSNGVLYANMGGEPTYSNVAEVCFNPKAKIRMIKENFRIKKKFLLQPGDYNSLLEIPGGVRLVARSAEPAARGPGSARPSAIQPPAGIRPLPLTSEVSFFYL
jgi:hypothetical protein